MVYTVRAIFFSPTVWLHYSEVKPLSSNFRMIAACFIVPENLGIIIQ